MHSGHRRTVLWRFNSVCCLLLLICVAVQARSKPVLFKRADFNACGASITSTAHSINVVAPLLQYTITSFDPNWFNTDPTQQGSPLFTITIAQALKPYADRLRLRVHVKADVIGGNSVEVFDRTTKLPFDSTKIWAPLTSGEVFALSYDDNASPNVKFENSELYNLVTQTHEVPPLNLHIDFSLLCSGAPITETGVTLTFSTKLRYVNTLQALSPGTDVGNARAVPIYTLSPLFQIVSDLFDTMQFTHPENDPNMEIFIYQLENGQVPKDALNGTEFARFPVNTTGGVTYPPNLPVLVPGKNYVWRVRGILRGTTNEYIYSNTLYFLVDPRLAGGSEQTSPEILSNPKAFAQEVRFGDDYVKRVLAALKLILGENYDMLALSHIDKIPAKGQIRLNGHPYSLEELERLAQEFHQSHHSLTRLRFQ